MQWTPNMTPYTAYLTTNAFKHKSLSVSIFFRAHKHFKNILCTFALNTDTTFSSSVYTNTDVIRGWRQGFSTVLEDKHIVLYWIGEALQRGLRGWRDLPFRYWRGGGEEKKRGGGDWVADTMTNTGSFAGKTWPRGKNGEGQEEMEKEKRGNRDNKRVERLEEDKHTAP